MTVIDFYRFLSILIEHRNYRFVTPCIYRPAAVTYRFDCNLAFTNIREKVLREGTATRPNTGDTSQQNCLIINRSVGSESNYFGSLVLRVSTLLHMIDKG